jgi:hypothetical protein
MAAVLTFESIGATVFRGIVPLEMLDELPGACTSNVAIDVLEGWA